MVSPVIVDLLQALGFQAHVIEGFAAARSLRRNCLHAAVIVRHVTQQNDAFLLDLGTFLPFMQPMDVTALIKEKQTNQENYEGVVLDQAIASPTYQGIDVTYQMVKGLNVATAFSEGSGRKVASYFDMNQVENAVKPEEDAALVTMITKRDIISINM